MHLSIYFYIVRDFCIFKEQLLCRGKAFFQTIYIGKNNRLCSW